jgi:hypothetical protein
MKNYIIQGRMFTGYISYDSEGLLELVRVAPRNTETPYADRMAATEWLLANVPVAQEQLPTFVSRLKGHGEVKEIPADLTFSAFWEKYAYKVGKKARAEKLWSQLTETEKGAAMLCVPRYEMWLLQHQGIQKLYPETFLAQRRWENEYSVK